jgi:thiol-disulfide isomerase/thioredoxin
MKLLEFYATWCGPCKVQKPIVEKLSKELQIEAEFIDIDERPEVAEKYQIRAVPSIVVIDDEGNFKKKLVGLQTAAVLKANIL